MLMEDDTREDDTREGVVGRGVVRTPGKVEGRRMNWEVQGSYLAMMSPYLG